MIIRKSKAEIENMNAAGRVVAETIAHVGEHLEPGITTRELDRIGEEFIRSQGAMPTSKGYKGFPASLCISPNSMIVHGIPGGYRVEEGDLISIDVGVTLDGFVADSAYTFPVGEISDETERLLETCQAALAAGIAEARVGNRVGDISAAIQQVSEEAGFGIVRSLVGHGVGRSGRGPTLSAGMTLAIEPMITAGGYEVYLHDDGWSISTEDESLAAHFEHTVAITEEGPRILTLAAVAVAPDAASGGGGSLLP